MIVYIVIYEKTTHIPYMGDIVDTSIQGVCSTFEKAKELCNGKYCDDYTIHKWNTDTNECLDDMYWEWNVE